MSSNCLWSDKKAPRLKAINLELSGHCNYKCTFCLNPQEGFRKKGFISEKLINYQKNLLQLVL
jgi:molybdenum cofactor biosynthesis enzyme MoaA